jgi:FkbM family methyltransferase
MTGIRKLVLKTLKAFNRDINIKHHYTGDKLLLNLYQHKGYWYYGKKREIDTITMFKKYIKEGDYIIEIGGHIGYMSLIFKSLSKDTGSLVVFEPSQENLKYLRENTKKYPQIKIEEKGVGNENKKAILYVENVTGQNNSFLDDYKVFDENNKNGLNNGIREKVEVEMIKLDTFILNNGDKTPDFVKIDVEGFESEVIEGANINIKKNKIVFMIEVTRNHDRIYNTFINANYGIFEEDGTEIKSFEQFISKNYANRFFIPIRQNN